MKIRSFRYTLILFAASIAVSGCIGTSHHNISLRDGYKPDPLSKIEVGKVTNETGNSYDVNVERLFADALDRRLHQEHLLFIDSTGRKLTANCGIVSYEKGNAFKRWLAPGWGATMLMVRCDLLDAGSIIGSLDADKTVSAGGGYTIGAWKSVFDDVAEDVVDDMKDKIE